MYSRGLRSLLWGCCTPNSISSAKSASVNKRNPRNTTLARRCTVSVPADSSRRRPLPAPAAAPPAGWEPPGPPGCCCCCRGSAPAGSQRLPWVQKWGQVNSTNLPFLAHSGQTRAKGRGPPAVPEAPSPFARRVVPSNRMADFRPGATCWFRSQSDWNHCALALVSNQLQSALACYRYCVDNRDHATHHAAVPGPPTNPPADPCAPGGGRRRVPPAGGR